MPVIQRTKHPAEDIEEFIIAGLTGDLRSEDVVLPFPVDIPQFEKRVSLVEGLPQDFKILFGVANHNEAGPGSGSEAGEQLYNQLGAGKLQSVNLQRVPADEAQRACYGPWGLEAAWPTQEKTKAQGQNTDAENDKGEIDRRKREFLLFLPDVDNRSGKACQQAQARAFCHYVCE